MCIVIILFGTVFDRTDRRENRPRGGRKFRLQQRWKAILLLLVVGVCCFIAKIERGEFV